LIKYANFEHQKKREGKMTKIHKMAMVTLVFFAFNSCGSDDDNPTTNTGNSLSSNLKTISNLPATTEIFNSNSGSAKILDKRLYAVSGTAPNLKDISSTNADSYFWNGLVAAINNAQSATEEQRQQFFGEQDGGPGGEGACRMAQNVGFSMEPIIQSGISACMMKNIPTASSGVSIDDTSIAASDLFSQQPDDRLVKVLVNQGANNTENVFIQIAGSNTVGSEVYKATLWFCDDGSSGTPNDLEVTEINTSNGTFSSINQGEDSEGKYYYNIQAYLTTSGSEVIFDTSKDRTASTKYSDNEFNSKSDITINSANNIITKSYHTFSSGNDSFTNKDYSKSEFSGTGYDDLKFLQAGYKGVGEITGSATESWNFSGGAEFQDSYYVATTTNPLATEAGTFDFDTDSFFSSLDPLTVDMGTASCSATPDVTVTIDLNDPVLGQIAATCGATEIQGGADHLNFCDGSSIQNARNYIWALTP
jgi:hypothetical protein